MPFNRWMQKNITDLRRRTRLGMGPCQGELCSYRAASLFNECVGLDGQASTRLLVDFLEERWKGVKPIFWGDALREAEFSYWIYQGLFGAGDVPKSPNKALNTEMNEQAPTQAVDQEVSQ